MIDLSPIVQIVVSLLSVAALVAGKIIIPRAVEWFTSTTKLNTVVEDTEIRNYFLAALDRGVALGAQKAKDANIKIDTDNQVAKFAYDYLLALVPDALVKFDLNEAGVTKLVQARLAEVGLQAEVDQSTLILG